MDSCGLHPRLNTGERVRHGWLGFGSFIRCLGGNNNSGDFDSLTTVSARENKDKGTIVFATNSLLSIGVTFPKLLLKILPGDKATIEERGGKAVLKTLDRDVTKSIQAFEQAYLKSK